LEGGGEDVGELEVAGGAGGLEDVEVFEANVGAGFEGVGTADEGEVIEELGDGGGELSVAAGGGA
jgi:hypothetical protein